jgi:hypothetical protein
VDPETSEPTTKLSRFARDFFAAAGSNVSDVSELMDPKPDDKALRAIQQGIDKANRRAVSRAQVIQKWTIIPRDFSITGGELGRCKSFRESIVALDFDETRLKTRRRIRLRVGLNCIVEIRVRIVREVSFVGFFRWKSDTKNLG